MTADIEATVAPRKPVISVTVSSPSEIPAQLVPVLFPPGSGGGGTFTWPQTTPLATWTVPHNLGKFPSVTVVDTTNTEVKAGVSYVDNNILQISFGSAFAGKAYLN